MTKFMSAIAQGTMIALVLAGSAGAQHINYASAVNSSATHLAGEQLASMADIKITHIPYKGSGPAIADLVGGQVQASFQTPIVAIPHIKTGKVKALAVSGERRPQIPDVPTFPEAGLAGFNGGTWFGVLAPAGTPKAVVDKVAQDLKRILSTPDFRDKLLNQR